MKLDSIRIGGLTLSLVKIGDKRCWSVKEVNERKRERERERERERGSKGWRRKRGNPPKYLGNGLLRPFLPLLSDPDPKWGKSLPCNSNFSDSRLGMKDIFVNFF